MVPCFCVVRFDRAASRRKGTLLPPSRRRAAAGLRFAPCPRSACGRPLRRCAMVRSVLAPRTRSTPDPNPRRNPVNSVALIGRLTADPDLRRREARVGHLPPRRPPPRLRQRRLRRHRDLRQAGRHLRRMALEGPRWPWSASCPLSSCCDLILEAEIVRMRATAMKASGMMPPDPGAGPSRLRAQRRRQLASANPVRSRGQADREQSGAAFPAGDRGAVSPWTHGRDESRALEAAGRGLPVRGSVGLGRRRTRPRRWRGCPDGAARPSVHRRHAGRNFCARRHRCRSCRSGRLGLTASACQSDVAASQCSG